MQLAHAARGSRSLPVSTGEHTQASPALWRPPHVPILSPTRPPQHLHLPTLPGAALRLLLVWFSSVPLHPGAPHITRAQQRLAKRTDGSGKRQENHRGGCGGDRSRIRNQKWQKQNVVDPREEGSWLRQTCSEMGRNQQGRSAELRVSHWINAAAAGDKEPPLSVCPNDCKGHPSVDRVPRCSHSQWGRGSLVPQCVKETNSL